MPVFVALLRGINVGGKAMVAMADLRAFFEALGFTGAKTLLQSGNVIFEFKAADPDLIEKKLETAFAKKFGRPVEFFVREKSAWEKIIAGNPYRDEAKSDPSHLVVLCLKSKPATAACAALKSAITGREIFRAGGTHLYIHYPDGIGTSKFTNAVIERKLGISGTARNWNTVEKIAALMESNVEAAVARDLRARGAVVIGASVGLR
jgi:uncharacterized protein (DUF1697 family)